MLATRDEFINGFSWPKLRVKWVVQTSRENAWIMVFLRRCSTSLDSSGSIKPIIAHLSYLFPQRPLPNKIRHCCCCCCCGCGCYCRCLGLGRLGNTKTKLANSTLYVYILFNGLVNGVFQEHAQAWYDLAAIYLPCTWLDAWRMHGCCTVVASVHPVEVHCLPAMSNGVVDSLLECSNV